MPETEKKAPVRKVKVAKDGVIHDGKGGFLSKGDDLPDGADTDSLKAKGYI